MCPCFTLRASDHLDDFVIEIGLVRLVQLAPVSSAPVLHAKLFEKLICQTFLWQTTDALLASAETWQTYDKHCERETPIRDMFQPQVPLRSACDKGGPVTAFTNDGSYWPNMGRFCPNFPTLGEYRKKHAYYMLYYTSNALSTKTSKILGPNLRQKKELYKRTLCLWLETCGIYLVNQCVNCTPPVLYQYRPILWNGVS